MKGVEVTVKYATCQENLKEGGWRLPLSMPPTLNNGWKLYSVKLLRIYLYALLACAFNYVFLYDPRSVCKRHSFIQKIVYLCYVKDETDHFTYFSKPCSSLREFSYRVSCSPPSDAPF